MAKLSNIVAQVARKPKSQIVDPRAPVSTVALQPSQEVEEARDQSRKPVDALTFVEAPWGLGMKLFPVQRVILKAHYGLPLDTKTKFSVTNWRREVLHNFTEAEYLAWIFDQGRSNVRTVEEGHERKNMVLSIGRRSGKCLVGPTLVLTDKGIFRLVSLDPNPEVQEGDTHSPLDVGVVQEGRRRSRSAFFYRGGKRETRRITTKYGYGVEGTPNHRVRVLSEEGEIVWRQLGDLRLGDYVCISRGTELWAETVVHLPPPMGHMALSEGLGYLLGYLLGHVPKLLLGLVTFEVKNSEVESLTKKLESVFGPVRRTSQRFSSILQVEDPKVTLLFKALGLVRTTNGPAPAIPSEILRSPRGVVAEFVRGLFDVTGTILDWSISFRGLPSCLVKDLQVVLLNFGVVTERNLRGALVVVGDDSRRIFCGLAKTWIPCANRREPTEDVPHCFERAKKYWGLDIGSSTRRPRGSGITRRMVTTFWLERLLRRSEVLPEDREVFQGLLDAGYFYDPVAKIETGEAQVYDLSVPEGESFTAGGLTNHNTTVSAAIAAYETYKLILKENPQTYYGITQSNFIRIISVATDKDQAGILFREVGGHFAKCAFFQAYMANSTQSFARLQTPHDIDKYGSYSQDPRAKTSIEVTFKACKAKGLRGAGIIVVILDEVAHFIQAGGSSADDVYNAVTPATAAFTQKGSDGLPLFGPQTPSDGRVILISSPLGEQGLFYQKFRAGFEPSGKDRDLCIQAPTWEVNPTISADVFEESFLRDVRVFNTEFGAEFSSRRLGWLPPEDVIACVRPGQVPALIGMSRIPYYAGLDLALADDLTALALVHLDMMAGRIQVDNVFTRQAEKGQRQDFDEVADWVSQTAQRFRIVEGLFDQWAGIPFEQALHKRGLVQFRSEWMTDQFNSQICQNFYTFVLDHKLALFDRAPEELASGKPREDYILELLDLQVEYKSKYMFKVSAPNIKGKHDDRSDALIRATWLASQKIRKPKILGGMVPLIDGVALPPGMAPVPGPLEILRSRQKLRQTGSHESRQVPRGRFRRAYR
jgi:intein/homing endonuclease